MKKISKRFAAFMLALIMTVTMLGADTLSAGAYSEGTEEIAVEETYNGDVVSETEDVVSQIEDEKKNDTVVSEETDDQSVSEVPASETELSESITEATESSEVLADEIELISEDDAVATVQEDAGITLSLNSAAIVGNGKKLSNVKLDLSDDDDDKSLSFEAVYKEFGDTDGVSNTSYSLSYDKSIIKLSKSTSVDSYPDYKITALKEGKTTVEVTLNATVKVFNGTYSKGLFGIKKKNYDKVSKTATASFDVTVYDSHTYSYVLSDKSNSNLSVAYCVAEKGKKGFIVKKNYSSVGEIVPLTTSSVATIGKNEKNYTNIFFVKGDATTDKLSLSVNGDSCTLYKISDVEKNLGKDSKKWWDICNWFGSNKYDLTGALSAASAAGYTYVGYIDCINKLSNQKDNVIKVTADPTGVVKYNMNGGVASDVFEETSEAGLYSLKDDKKYFYGNKIILPSKEPTLEGYTFSGWAESADGTGSFDITYPNAATLTLYATWTVNTYEVVFWNGDDRYDTQIVDYNTKAVKPADPTKESDILADYTFAKWLDKDGKEFDFDTAIKSDVELYADYSAQYMTYIFEKVGTNSYSPNGWKKATKIPAKATETLKKLVKQGKGAFYKDIDDIVDEADVRKALNLPESAIITYVKFSLWPEGLHMDVLVQRELTADDVEISIEDIYYGDTQLISTIVYGNKTLVEGTDYVISCKDEDYNTKPGSHQATVKFIGDYTGEITGEATSFNVNAVYADFYKKYFDEEKNKWVYTAKDEIGRGILSRSIYEMTLSEDWDASVLTKLSTIHDDIKKCIVKAPIEGAIRYILLSYDGKKASWRVEFYQDYLPLNFYVTKQGHTVPNNLKSDSSKYYSLVGKGTANLDKIKPTLDYKEIDEFVKKYPTDSEMKAAILSLGYTEAEYTDFGLVITWQRLIEEKDGWHVDGDVYQTKDKDGDIDPIPYVRKTVTVSWVDEDKSTKLSDDETYYYGETPSYKGLIPTKASSFDKIYSFAGFAFENGENEDKLSSDTVLRGDVTFFAKYSETDKEKSVVNFYDADHNLIKSVVVTYENGQRTEIEVPVNPIKNSTNSSTYQFLGWYEEASDGTKTLIPDVAAMEVPAGSVVNLVASFSESVIYYTVNFYDEDGSVLYGTVSNYTYNELLEDKALVAPVKASTAVMDYVFDGWRLADGSRVTNVTDNIDVYASYISGYLDYVVTFKNYDGSVLATNSYHYGDMLNSQAIPLAVRLSDDNYNYVFAGWEMADKTIASVNSLTVKDSFVLTATYTASPKAQETPTTITTPEKVDDKSVEDGNGEATNATTVPTVDDEDKDKSKKTKKADANDSDENNGDASPNANQNANQNNDNQEDIPETVVPLSDGSDTSSSEIESEVESESEEATEVATETSGKKEIDEFEPPLGAKEDNCIIHWIILLLTLFVAAYTIIRVIAMNSGKETEDNKQQA